MGCREKPGQLALVQTLTLKEARASVCQGDLTCARCCVLSLLREQRGLRLAVWAYRPPCPPTQDPCLPLWSGLASPIRPREGAIGMRGLLGSVGLPAPL